MTVSTIYSDASDGMVQSSNVVYAAARSGSGLVTSSGLIQVGQEYSAGYFVYEGFVSFDTSGIPDGDAVSAVTLALFGNTDGSTTDFTLEARPYNWGATLGTDDFVAGASLSGLTPLLASLNTYPTFGTFTYHYFSESGSNLRSAINKTGTTYINLSSSRMKDGNTPTGYEWVSFYSSETLGTSQDPYISVTHAAPPVAAFSASLVTADAYRTIFFTDSSTGSPTSWSWKMNGAGNTNFVFTGGTDATSQNPQGYYTVTGTYTVTLTVTNGGGSDDEVKTNYITIVPVPVAAFSVNDVTADVNQNLTFTDASTGTPASWSWKMNGAGNTGFTFTGGTSATSQSPQGYYTAPGVYSVTLTVTNYAGTDDEVKSNYITVAAPGGPRMIV